MDAIKIQLFKDSYAPFTELLGEHDVKFSRRIQLSETILASGAAIEVISAIAQATPWGALAICVVAWMGARKSRKVILTTKDNEVIHLDGYSSKEVETLLNKAKELAIIETKNDCET